MIKDITPTAGVDMTQEEVRKKPSGKNKMESAEGIDQLTSVVESAENTLLGMREMMDNVSNTLLDDFGAMKDFGNLWAIQELEGRICGHAEKFRQLSDATSSVIKKIPTLIPSKVETVPNKEMRDKLDQVLATRRDVLKLYLPSLCGIIFVCVMLFIGGLWMLRTASDRRADLEAKIEAVDQYHRENAEAVTFTNFYRENYPKDYRKWRTGDWQKELALRDSILHAAKMQQLRKLAQKF